MRKTSFLVPVAGLSLAVLSGCASMVDDPHLKDKLTYLDTTSLDDQAESERLSFLARYMMERDDRAELEANLAETEYVQQQLASEASVVSQMAVDWHQGQFGSTMGDVAGVGVFAAGVVLGEMFDGSMDKIGQGFLPADMHGEAIDSEQAARGAFHDLVARQITIIAERMDWELTCHFGCERGSTNMVYLLENTNGYPLPERFIYAPDQVVMHAQVTNIEKVDPNDPTGAFLGFQPAWQTALGNTFLVNFYSEPVFDDDGDLIIHTGDNGFRYPAVNQKMEGTYFETVLAKAFHSSRYTLSGNQDVHPKRFFFDGGSYSFVSNSDTAMIDNLLLVPDALPERRPL